MAVIRANRESIDDRFNVLGFTVRSEQPWFEVGLATDPELLRAEHRGKRNAGNFYASGVMRAGASQRGEAVYLVPPDVVARFVGQQRLYFGLATYRENDRSTPHQVQIPDRGRMYVALNGLTERGFRRSLRGRGGSAYGADGTTRAWGGDAANGAAVGGASGNGARPVGAATPGAGGASNAAAREPAPYSDGFSDDLWRPSPSATPVSNDGPAASGDGSRPTQRAPEETPPAVAPVPSAPAPASAPVAQGLGRAAPRARELLISNDYRPSNWFDALRAQLGFFVDSAIWYLGVNDTTVMPHAATCQVRVPNGTAEGGLHGTAFFIAPRILLTAAHVVDGQSELIIVPGKNGGGVGRATEPFGRFQVRSTHFRKFTGYTGNGDFDRDMALILVPAANAAPRGRYFNLVEELTQSRPEGVVVTGYAAWWEAHAPIEQYVNDTIDPNKQHMMGGHIRDIPTDGTFTYNIQTLAGTSGSPVYWIEERANSTPRAHLVGVHVAAMNATSNRGCRITGDKLTWIRDTARFWGQSLSFSLGADGLEDEDIAGHVHALDAGDSPGDVDGRGITEGVPDDDEDGLSTEGRGVEALTTTTPDYPGARRFVPAAANNYGHRRTARTIDRIVIHITDGGSRIAGTIGWFQNPDQRDSNGNHITVSAHYVVGQDGEVVQMVRDNDVAWHASAVNGRSIGIEHVAHKRRPAQPARPATETRRATRARPAVDALPPSDDQYRASAQLVAWLCQRHGVPVDREHIIGHREASPRDNHDCPSGMWQWDRFMTLVQEATRALALPAGTGGAGGAARGDQIGRAMGAELSADAYASAQEVIEPFYDASNPDTALTCQDNAFSRAREEWFVGVDNTRSFPHSAICQLNMVGNDGRGYGGTGFYIGRNRILTCAHNLHNMRSVQIIPGRNGAGSGSGAMPFGQTTLTSSSWRVAPGYTGAGDYDDDLAVIDNVPIAAPNGRWFEFLNATPSDRLPIVVCGYSGASDAVPGMTDIIDADKQHLHGGYVRRMPTPDTVDYPILTLHGASGSPVYTLEREGGRLKAKICAVHVSGRPAARDNLNRGCFITPRKIDWIEGRATSFSLGDASGAQRGVANEAPSQALIIGPEDVEQARRYAPQWLDLYNWQIPASVTSMLTARGMREQKIREAHGSLNLDRYEVRCTRLPSGMTDAHLLNRIRTDINAFIDTDYSEFAPYEAADATRWTGASPLGSVIYIDIAGPDNASVVASLVEERRWRFTTVHASRSGDHPVSGHREFGVRRDGDAWIFYTRGVDRWTGGVGESIAFAAADRLWRSFQIKLVEWINGHGGAASVVQRFSERFHPEVVRILYGATAQSLDASSSEALPDYPVHLVPQPNKTACWAAAMAMLLSFRGNASHDPEQVVNAVGATLAASYDMALLRRVRALYGFDEITQPSNTTLYHAPRQWADWLRAHGPLWTVIVGAPHAVVVAGIRGDLDDPASVQVKILNPWDTRVAFDNDPVEFRPANHGYEDWFPFTTFARDFGDMAEENYGNWRILHLPVAARGARAQSLADTPTAPARRADEREVDDPARIRLRPPPAPVTRELAADARALDGGATVAIATTILGAVMERASNNEGDITWELDQLRGFKHPNDVAPSPLPPAQNGRAIRLTDWPAVEVGFLVTDEISAGFEINWQYNGKSVGNVLISNIRTNDAAGMGLIVKAKIMDDNIVYPRANPTFAALLVRFEYRFTHFVRGDMIAIRDIRLFGDGTWTDEGRWEQT